MWRPVSAKSALLLLSLVAGSTAGSAAELTFEISIEHGRVADPMRLIRVHQGDRVKLRWRSDRPLTLHLHGYDIEQRVVADTVTELAFTANAAGRFPIEIHAPTAAGGSPAHEAAPLAVVEV